MIDFGKPFRRRLLDGPSAQKRHYRELISEGFSEGAASRISGHDPMQEYESAFIAFMKWGVTICIAVLLSIWISHAEAVEARMEYKGVVRTKTMPSMSECVKKINGVRAKSVTRPVKYFCDGRRV